MSRSSATAGARVAKLLLACALASAPLPAQDAASDRPDQRVQLDFRHYYTLDELDAALAALAAAYPEFLRLESLGRSAGGTELWVLTATRLADGDAGDKPGLVVVGGVEGDDLWGTEVVLFTALELVQNHLRDPRVEALLDRASIYFVPALNPDLRAARLEPNGAAVVSPLVEGNFEIGWRPGMPGAGPYPLSGVEAHALARFLLEHDNVAEVLRFARGVELGRPAGLPELSARDLALHSALAERVAEASGAVVLALTELALEGGTLLEFGLGHRGAFGFELATDEPGAETGGGLPDVDDLFGLGRGVFAATLELGAALPRLELGSRELVRVSTELWQLDLAVSNTGFLPTLPDLGDARRAAARPRLDVEGAQLLAAAVADGTGTYAPVRTRDQGLALAELGGGAHRALRLVLRAAPETTVAVEVRAPRAGSARLELTLQ